MGNRKKNRPYSKTLNSLTLICFCYYPCWSYRRWKIPPIAFAIHRERIWYKATIFRLCQIRTRCMAKAIGGFKLYRINYLSSLIVILSSGHIRLTAKSPNTNIEGKNKKYRSFISGHVVSIKFFFMVYFFCLKIISSLI